MTCACAKPIDTDAAMRLAERAAMCLGCHRGYPSCEGVTVEGRVIAGDCPRGKFPDDDGLTRWLYIRWRGVPLPLRWWAYLKSRKVLGDEAMRPKDYPGCGCVEMLKRLTERS